MSTARAIPPEPVWPISVARYHKMIASGVLTSDDQVELLEGWILPKMPKNPPHCFTSETIAETLQSLQLPGYFIRSQNPITTRDSEPEPDVSIIRGERKDFTRRHPRPADSAVVIEVAESSLSRDRGLKKRVYARAKVPIYWIVNLDQHQIEVHSQPFRSRGEPDYGTVKVYGRGKQIPLILDGREYGRLVVDDLFAK